MISADNKSMQEAGETLFILNGDDRSREQCEAREDYRRTWEGVKQDRDEMQAEIVGVKMANGELNSLNAEKDKAIYELESSNEEKDTHIALLEEQVAELRRRLQGNVE